MRRPIPWRIEWLGINPAACKWGLGNIKMADKRKLGVDLGGSKIEAALLDIDGTVIERIRVATPQDDYQATLNGIAALLEQLDKKHSSESLPLGIGTPGSPSTRDNLMKNCNSTCLNGQPLKDDLEKRLKRAVRLANDADCFALAEACSGAAKGANSVFGVILGTGVGGGIVINQKLLQGPSHIAGEWGHNPLALDALVDSENLKLNQLSHNQNKRPCYCGRHNCVESWLSGPALSQSDWELNKPASLRSAASIAQAAAEGEAKAQQTLKHYAEMLALALANVINIIDPEVIVLGGGLSNIDQLYEDLPSALERYVFSDEILCRIVAAKQGDSAGVIGAAHLW